MGALLLGGYLCTQAPLQAQQMENHNEDLLDLNQKKVDPETYNGSSYTIDGEMFRNMPVTHLANVLTGIMPGFFTRQTSGSVIDEAPDYWIRGRRTTAEGILVLVDGQERSFGSLSTYEIDKITILKDAAAVALYGMRAANGAILVTTRRGQTGKPSIEFTAQLASQQPLRVPKPLNAYDYTRLNNEAYLNDNPLGVAPYADPNLYLNSTNPERYPDMDWLGKYYDTEQLMQRYNLNVSGGTSRTRYFVNFGALMHEGMYNTDKATTYSTDNEISRYNIRSNFQVDVTPTTLLTADVYGWVENQNRPNNSSINAFTSMLQTPAHVFPAYYTDHGNYKDLLGQPVIGVNGKIIAGDSKYVNPWPQINRAGYGNYNEIYGSFRVKLEQDLAFLLSGLKVSGDISMDSQMSWVVNRTKGFAYYEFENDSTL
jgi:TonB-dependent SusC/RagA subfamily outer membrane receptor